MLRICPHCGCSQVARSSRRGLFDRIFLLFGRKPYRCQVCSTRFFSVPEIEDSAPKQDPTQTPPAA